MRRNLFDSLSDDSSDSSSPRTPNGRPVRPVGAVIDLVSPDHSTLHPSPASVAEPTAHLSPINLISPPNRRGEGMSHPYSCRCVQTLTRVVRFRVCVVVVLLLFGLKAQLCQASKPHCACLLHCVCNVYTHIYKLLFLEYPMTP